MKFLTDENVATSVVYELRKAGFDIKDIKEEQLHGSTDKEVLQLANKERRIIITHDKDFANIAFSQTPHKGIILLRFKQQQPTTIKIYLIKTLQSKLVKKIPHNLTILSETKTVIHHHQ